MKNKIKEAYLKYIDEAYSARSSRPANIMHDAIRDAILTVIDPRDGFDVQTNANGGEYKFESMIHEKKIDVTVVDKHTNNAPIVAISFKMPLMSVNKNLKNYFEMNIGDATLVKDNGVPFYYFMILDNSSLKKENDILRIEGISDKSIEPFNKVMNSKIYSSFRPNYTFILRVDFGDNAHKQSYENLSFFNFKNASSQHKIIVNDFEPIISVYNNDKTWTTDFDEKFDLFKKSIQLEIELYKIRKKL